MIGQVEDRSISTRAESQPRFPNEYPRSSFRRKVPLDLPQPSASKQSVSIPNKPEYLFPE